MLGWRERVSIRLKELKYDSNQVSLSSLLPRLSRLISVLGPEQQGQAKHPGPFLLKPGSPSRWPVHNAPVMRPMSSFDHLKRSLYK